MFYYKAFIHVTTQVLRTKAENKARGFGFVSFLDPMDCAKAIREMNGKYLASRYKYKYDIDTICIPNIK